MLHIILDCHLLVLEKRTNPNLDLTKTQSVVETIFILFHMLLNMSIDGFVGYLLIYHIYLKYVGKSTYQHIVEKRKKASEKKS